MGKTVYETIKNAALSFTRRNSLLYVDISECILRGAAVILYAENSGKETDGVLLYERESGIYMLAAETEAGANAALDRLDERDLAAKSRWLVARGELARKVVYERLTIERETACFQVAYLSKKPFALKGTLTCALPKREHIERIKKDYSLESPENIERLCGAGKILCAFLATDMENVGEKGEFVGFIGEHPEGSMGLLQIFPKYRRNGFAEELEKYQINRYIAGGRVPYGHVIEDNAVSLSLQEKLGMETANEKVYWLRDGLV